MRVLDLFSGIGGFSLGLEAAGFETVAFCEIEPYCQKVLKRHWPEVPIYDDVKQLTAARLAAEGIEEIEVICGGFPCQDLSYAGKRAGLAGARSGLWREYARLIGELRPRFVIVENVPGLLTAGFGVVLGDLAARGYDAFWDCIPASAVGASHVRDRVWIVAHADKAPCQGSRVSGRIPQENANTNGNCSRPQNVSYTDGARQLSEGVRDGQKEIRRRRRDNLGTRDSDAGKHARALECFMGGGPYGLSERLDTLPKLGETPFATKRLAALGNAVVPQIPYLIGRAIMGAMNGETK